MTKVHPYVKSNFYIYIYQEWLQDFYSQAFYSYKCAHLYQECLQASTLHALTISIQMTSDTCHYRDVLQ